MEDKLYRYWLFYTKENHNPKFSIIEPSSDKITLCAYTNSKKTRKAYKDIHNMKLIVEVESYLTKEEVNRLACYSQTKIIREIELPYQNRYDMNYEKISVAITESEYGICEHFAYFHLNKISKLDWNQVLLSLLSDNEIKPKYKKALNVLGALKAIKHHTSTDTSMIETFNEPNMYHILKNVIYDERITL